MSLEIGIGISTQSQDAHEAGREAGETALKNLNGAPPGIAVVLASSVFDQENLLAGVRSALSDVPLVGCTTAGAITDEGIIENGVSVMALSSKTMTFTPVKVENISENMKDAGRAFGKGIAEGSEPKLAFIFSDALSGNGTELVRGVFEERGASFPLVGGAAGDDMNFKKTYQYFNDEVLTNAAVGFGVAGEFVYAVGADHGWEPIGNPRKVTRAEGTTLFELDGGPAFEIYNDYFGERANDFKKALSLAAVSYPLGMKVEGSEKMMIRVPLSVNDDGSIVCGAEVLEGSAISLMIGTVSSALWAAKTTAKDLVEKSAGARPKVVFVSNCVARKVLYGERAKEELDALREIAGDGAHIFGFFSYGQISPFNKEPADINTCDPGFYEQSISIAVFGE